MILLSVLVCRNTKVPRHSVNLNALSVASARPTKPASTSDVATHALEPADHMPGARCSSTIQSVAAHQVTLEIRLFLVRNTKMNPTTAISKIRIRAFHHRAVRTQSVRSNKTDPFVHALKTLLESPHTAVPSAFSALNVPKTRLAFEKNALIHA